MKKLFVTALLISLISPVIFGLRDGVSIGASSDGGKGFSFLIVGFDDAAENTDAMLLLSYSPRKNAVSFLQIPRDTYYNSGTGTNRINSVYGSHIAKGESKKDAMSALVGAVSSALGVRIDGYAGYNGAAFKRMIGAIGDLTIELPEDMTYVRPDGEIVTVLKKGANILNPEEALSFVRFREGYLMGDVGRVDAQKLFFRALAAKLRSDFGLKMAFRLLSVGSEGIVTDISAKDMVSIAIKNRTKIKNATALFATLPGSTANAGALGWYYAVNKDASVKVLSDLELTVYRQFDLEGKLVKADSEEFLDIYNKINHPYRIYDEDTLSDLDIKLG